MSTSQFISANTLADQWNEAYFALNQGWSSQGTLEAIANTLIRDAGTASNLYSIVVANASGGNTVITLRKNSADTAVTVTYSTGQTGVKEDTSNTASFSAGDYGCWEFSNVNSGNVTMQYVACNYAPTTSSNTLTKFVICQTNSAINADEQTFFVQIGGDMGLNTSEDDTLGSLSRFNEDITLSDLYVYVLTNAKATDSTTIEVRNNGASGNQSVVYTAGQTGAKEDTSNTDTITAQDPCNYRIYPSGTETNNCSVRHISTSAVTTSDSFFIVRKYIRCDWNSSDFYYALAENSNATEANVELLSRFTWYARSLLSVAESNTFDGGTASFKFRKNQANTDLSLSFSAGQTGLKVDTDEITVASGTDKVCFMRSITGATSGTVKLRSNSLIGSVTQSSPPITFSPFPCHLNP